MKENQMTNEDEKVAVENETPEATQETEAPEETPAEPAEETPAEEPKTYGDRLRDAAVSELDQLIK